MYAAVLGKPSTALVCNPQTDISKYSYFQAFKEKIWAGWADSELPFPISVVPFYAQPSDAKVIYIQNSHDWEHVKNHRRPWVKRLFPENALISLMLDLGTGHVGPDKESIVKVFQVVERERDWGRLEQALKDLEIHSVKTRTGSEV